MRRTNFFFSDESEPHRIRTRNILKEKPEIRNLIGKNPYTFFAILFLVGLQVTLAWLLRDSSWWAILGVAYLVGAFADHALFVMIHECSHNLLFKKKSHNTLAAILSNLPQVFPSAVHFARYHIKHHSFQGIYELDADLPNKAEARLINNYFIGKIVWLLFYPFFQTLRTSRLKEIAFMDGWVALNLVLSIAFDVAIIYFFGWTSFFYLLSSFFFSVGLHPLGARWIQEHYLTKGEQETYSYYGPLNTVAFNVGYHNEHHDFPSIPWNKLPKIRESAPRYYNSLTYHMSWTKLFFRFLFDKEISLYHRVVRNKRGNVSLFDESKPDVEIEQPRETEKV
jgi:sphingolipid delta-4 desaturase